MITNNKFIFHFLVILLSFLMLPFPLNTIPGLGFIETFISDCYHTIIPWFAKNVLLLEKEITVFTNGSGDTTYDYVLLLCFTLLSLLIAFVWTFIFKKNTNYEKVNYWFLVFLRFFVGYTMLSYGMYKVIPLQFNEPSFYRLLKPYGESSPMGLAWTFIGASKGYVIFGGLMEVIGGVLLFHRRTSLLGSLILIPVLLHVVSLNFCYDIPVKLFSSQLLLMVIIILTPQSKRLFRIILLNLPTDPIRFKEFITTKRWLLVKHCVKWGLVIFFLYINISEALESANTYGRNAPKPALYGLYEVINFKANNKELPPILTDTLRWRYIVIERQKSIQFYRTNMSRFGFVSEIDTLSKQITLTHFRDSSKVYTLHYKKETDSTMRFRGCFVNDSIDCQTNILNKEDFLLTGRGFNWIQEHPYNR